MSDSHSPGSPRLFRNGSPWSEANGPKPNLLGDDIHHLMSTPHGMHGGNRILRFHWSSFAPSPAARGDISLLVSVRAASIQ